MKKTKETAKKTTPKKTTSNNDQETLMNIYKTAKHPKEMNLPYIDENGMRHG
ncbi:MAG: hypothetical protein IJW67_13575 [Blautia sp.]|nr:hypothetical protein [Blautia sp.]